MNKTDNELGDLSKGAYGIATEFDDAEVVMVPVPTEFTVSSGKGTKEAIEEGFLNETAQVEIYNPYFHRLTQEEPPILWANTIKIKDTLFGAENAAIKAYKELSDDLQHIVNPGKVPFLIGGEHLCSIANIEALSQHHNKMNVIVYDAHADLRQEYNGMTYNHACVMYLASKYEQVKQINQVGIRELSAGEMEYASSSEKVNTYMYGGQLYESQKIVSGVDNEVYLSIDIDVLDVEYCPNTGTPVPGGLKFNELIQHLLSLKDFLKFKGCKIVGMDLVEVGNGKVDLVVATRLAYFMSLLAIEVNRHSAVVTK